MEIKNVYSIDHLTTESVSVKTQKTLSDGIQSYPLGEPMRTAYTKDELKQLKDSVPEPYLSAILEVWGISDIDSSAAQQEAGKEQNEASGESEE